MRNFEQRRAEVYRRSEQRIKENKRKIKTTVTAIVTPVVLCSVLAGAYFNTVMSPAHEQDSSPGATRGEMDNLSTDRRYPEGTEKTDETKGASGETQAPETEGLIPGGDTAGTVIPADTEIVIAPADSDAGSAVTNAPSSTSTPEDTEIVIVPADSEVGSAVTNAPSSTSTPEDTGRYGVRLETYVNLPNGMASVTLDAKTIKIVTNLIHEYTNGEVSLYSWGKDTTASIPSISTTVPDSVVTVKITDNFGLSWNYEITRSSIVYIPNGRAYPITDEQFNTIIDKLNIYLP